MSRILNRQLAGRMDLPGSAAILLATIVVLLQLASPSAAVAQPSRCTSEGQLLPSPREVGLVYAQGGSTCPFPAEATTTIEARYYRDSTLIGTATARCGPGQFQRTEDSAGICTTRHISATDPAGAQDFRLIVEVRFIATRGGSEQRTSSTTTGTY